MKRTVKPKQLKLSRQVVRQLSGHALGGVHGGIDPHYTSACATQTNLCLSRL